MLELWSEEIWCVQIERGRPAIDVVLWHTVPALLQQVLIILLLHLCYGDK